MNTINIDNFVADYLATACWITCDSGECTDFTRDAKKYATADCLKFIEMVKAEFGEDKAIELLTVAGNDLGYLAAHDLFLTRNHHGAGFWDKGNMYGEGESLQLTEIAQKMKESNCYHIRGNKSKLTFD